MSRGKNYLESIELVGKNKTYEVDKAIELCLKTAKAKFDETVEIHVRLGVDSRHADQQVRGAGVLPNGTGKKIKVLAVCRGESQKIAKGAGADFIGAEEITTKIQNEGWTGFDLMVTMPDMMGLVGRLGKVLGPRGLMPNPKAGTVTPNIAKAIKDAKAGKIEYKLDKNNIIHCPIGKISFGESKLLENFTALMSAIVKAKPSNSKGQYIKSCVLASTMGPGVKILTSKAEQVAVST